MTAGRLYFAQHAIAMSKTENPERPLSDAGTQQTLSVARQLQAADLPISQIFHSGKLRAEQTANIFAATFNITSVSAIDYLSPNDDVNLLTANLNTDNALYVGHLPHLEKLVSFLVTGSTAAGIITFQNSAAVCLERINNKYSVQWYLTPTLATK